MTTPMPLAATQSSSTRTRAFSLIEVLLSIIILGIGVIGIAALFPAGIVQQQRSVDDIMGPIVANNAMATLRSKLRPEFFGSYEDFGTFAPEFSQVGTVRGDWLWRRPGVMYEDDPATDRRDERGAIDIFSGDPSLSPGTGASESPHIPFNPVFFGGTGSAKPVVVFTQGERMYPMSENARNMGVPKQGQYYWDCMFRRFQGKILVAIFVYRVNVPQGEDYIYSVPRHQDTDVTVPIVPYHRAFVDVTAPGPWIAALSSAEYWSSAAPGDFDITEIPETDPETNGIHSGLGADGTDDFDDAWQATSQWLLDQNNNVHRVLAGRDKFDEDPVKLVSPISRMAGPNAFSGASVFFYDRVPLSGAVGSENIVTNIWYIPRQVLADFDGTAGPETPITLTPVFVTVEEL